MKPGILRFFAPMNRRFFEQMQSQFTNAEEGTMKVQTQGETLNVSGIKELGAANSQTFRDEVRGALGERQKNIEIDLSETMFVDSCGLGALISICGLSTRNTSRLDSLTPSNSKKHLYRVICPILSDQRLRTLRHSKKRRLFDARALCRKDYRKQLHPIRNLAIPQRWRRICRL